MPAATITAIAFEPGEEQLILHRRRRAEARLSRERKRNSHLALMGFIGVSIALAIGLHSTLAPAAEPAQLTSLNPADLEFQRTHVGHVLLTSADSAYCRELRFDNDTGHFGDGGRYRCFIDNEPTLNPGAARARLAGEADARTDRLNSFSKAR